MPDNPTLRDIAQRTGYCVATVSMALRDHARFPESTRRQIQAVAREMGYRPDPVLASIAAHHWQRAKTTSRATLAAIADQKVEGWEGLEARAQRLGYLLELHRIADYRDGRRLSDVLYHRGILGVLVGQIFTPGFCESFDWAPFTAVAVSEGDFRPPIHLVMPNHFRAVQRAWDLAQSRGCQRIGMALFDLPAALDVRERLAAFQERQSQVPAPGRVGVLTVRSPDSSKRRACVAEIATWLRAERPDAVLGFNSGMNWLVREACRQARVAPVLVALWKSVHDTEWPGLLLPPDEIGSQAVDWMDVLLRAGGRGLPAYPVTVQIEMRWDELPGETQPNMPPSAC